MKTAKQIVDDFFVIGKEKHTSQLIQDIREYARQKCRVQTGECHAELKWELQREGIRVPINVLNAPINATMPNFE